MNRHECEVEGCDRPTRCKGLCNKHYERLRRTGSIGVAGDARRKPAVQCSVDGCPKEAKARTLCAGHYANWRTTGDPIPRKRPTYGQNVPRVNARGYRIVYDPEHPLAMADGYVYEHRKVAWDEGLLTDPNLIVHHRNGDRGDNRIENLEVKAQGVHVREHVEERGYVDNQYGRHAV